MTATKRAAPRWRASRYGHAAIASEMIRCTATPRGGRHNQIYATARRVGELVGGGEIDEDFARHRLVEMGRRLKPEEIGEITRAVNDGIRKGMLTPRSGAQPGVGIHIKTSTDAVLAIWAMADAVLARTRGWNSRTAGTDQRVLLALCSMAIRCYKTRFGVSVRQLAEEAGVGVATAHRSLVRLEGIWLRRTHIAGQRTSDDRTTVQLLVRKSYVEELTGEVGIYGAGLEAYGTAKGASVPSLPSTSWKPAGMSLGDMKDGLASPSFPLWRRRSNAWRIWVALAGSPGERVAVSEISKALEMPVRTVASNLVWLAQAGICDSSDGRWWATPRNASQVADELELPDPEIRRARHRIDRALHKLRLFSNASHGAFRKGAFDADELERRRLSVAADAIRLAQERAVVSGQWKAAYARARANELARKAPIAM